MLTNLGRDGGEERAAQPGQPLPHQGHPVPHRLPGEVPQAGQGGQAAKEAASHGEEGATEETDAEAVSEDINVKPVPICMNQ